MLLIILSFIISALTCLLIIRYSHLHKCMLSDTVGGGPQKFHARPVPRVGGVAVMAGLIAALIVMVWDKKPFIFQYSLLLVCSLPAFLSGLAEDVTKGISIFARLFMTIIAAVLGFFIIDAELTRLSLPFLDNWLLFMPFSLVFTAFAVAGVSNAINIIDGYNGLAGVVAAFILAALAYVSYKVGDFFLVAACVSLLGAVSGFIIWNYPNGLIFLGDGGAYLIGFMIAELSVLLVNRHPEVSPWFPMLLVMYPVWETLFSIYRKKFLRGQSPGIPDSLHFHMMVYKRLLRWAIGKKEAKYQLQRNAMTSPYLWGLSLLAIVPATLFWRYTIILVCFAIFFVAIYLWLYWKIVQFETPKWLVIRSKRRSTIKKVSK